MINKVINERYISDLFKIFKIVESQWVTKEQQKLTRAVLEMKSGSPAGKSSMSGAWALLVGKAGSEVTDDANSGAVQGLARGGFLGNMFAQCVTHMFGTHTLYTISHVLTPMEIDNHAESHDAKLRLKT